MKKLVFVSLIMLAFVPVSHSQDGDRIFKKFKGDLSLGYANFPGNTDIKNGFIFTLEPKYAVLDQLALGARYETTIMFKDETRYDAVGNPIETDLKTKIAESLNITADFYFTNNYSFRPFAGLGGGIFHMASTMADDSYYTNEDNSSSIKFGGMLRLGTEIKHFRISFEYNLIPSSTETRHIYDSNTGSYLTTAGKSKNAYIGIKLGVCFGGGPKQG